MHTKCTLASDCTRYTIHRCTYWRLNRHTCTRRKTHTYCMRSCRHTMPIERLDTLTTQYGPSWPSVPLSACQALLDESPRSLFLYWTIMLPHCSRPHHFSPFYMNCGNPTWTPSTRQQTASQRRNSQELLSFKLFPLLRYSNSKYRFFSWKI